MKTMQYFKLRFRLVSPLCTPLAADTLFGHLCWATVYGEGGEPALEEFLGEMSGAAPPLLLSDPLPSGMFPVPVLPSANPRHWAGKPTKEQDRLKDLCKKRLFPLTSFSNGARNLNPAGLMKTLAETKEEPLGLQAGLVPHNAIDRLGGGTIPGGIFFQEEFFVDSESGAEYDLYVATTKYDSAQIQRLFQKATEGGYGSDKSTGRGVLKWLDITPWTLPTITDANAVMLLGPCAPAANDPTEGFWKIQAKAGRLGGHWAIHENPFKRTIMMLQAGSVLRTETPKPFYGRMVANAHPELPQVRHYGLALAVPIQLDLTEAEEA